MTIIERMILIGRLGVVFSTASVAASAAPPAFLTAPLSTQGNQVVDADRKPIRILGVGMWLDEGVSEKMPLLASAGFNTIRLDWSNRSIDKLPELDRVIEAADKVHLKVILDDHSNEAGAPGPWKPCYAQQKNGLWYDSGGASDNTDGCDTPGTVTDSKFIADWQTMARHYRNNSAVVGYDLWNEPSGYPGMSTWAEGDHDPDHNIRYMCERAGNAILAIDPAKLIICEGPMNAHQSRANPNTPAPWGDLSLAARYPVRLSVPNRLVYSVHDYPTEIIGTKPDNGPVKVAQMNKVWGYLVRDHIAPVWIGEMGANMTSPDHQRWAQTLIDYANGKLGSKGGPTFADGEQGIGINWWFAGHDPYGNPHGIFDSLGQLDETQRATYNQFKAQ
jgi:endoglucanase